MSNFEVSNPVLNSSFEEPKAHWRIVEGKTLVVRTLFLSRSARRKHNSRNEA